MKGGMNLVSNNKSIVIKHNLLDVYLYNELKSSSNILKGYDQILSTIDIDLLGLDEVVFYMLYKHIIKHEKNGSLKDIIAEELLFSTTLDKIRTRTVGSSFETYLCLKFIMDQLIIRMRGSERISELRRLAEIIDKSKTSYSNIIEKLEKLSQLKIKKYFNIFDLTNISSEQLDIFMNTILKSTESLVKELSLFNLSNDLMDHLIGHLSLSDISSSTILSSFNDIIRSRPNSEEVLTSIQFNDLLDDLINNHKLDISVEEFINQVYEVQNSSDEIDGAIDSIKEEDATGIYELSSNDPEQDSGSTDMDTISQSESNPSTSTGLEGFMTENQLSNPSYAEGESKNSRKLGDFLSDSKTEEATDESVIIDSKLHDTESILEEITGFFKEFDGKGNYNNYNDSIYNVNNLLKKAFNVLSDLSGKLISEKSQMLRLINSLNVQGILDNTVKKIDITNEHIDRIGITSHSLKSLSFDEAVDLDKRLSSSEFKKFIDKVGRKKAVAKKARMKLKTRKDKLVDKIILSDDIDYIAEDEMINLSLGVFEFDWDFYDRYLNRGILTYELVSNDSKGKGPIVLCYDGSGSMEGNKILETKAHIIAIIEIAKFQKRNIVLIQFSSKDEPLIIKELSPVNVTPSDIFEIYDTFIRGGTDFEKPLKKAMEYLTKSSYKEGDILFITDGFCEISSRFILQFQEAKIHNKFKLYSIIIQGQTYHDYGDLGKLSDEVLEIKRSGGSEWNDKVSERIFSLI